MVSGTRYPLKFIYAVNNTGLEKAQRGALKLISKGSGGELKNTKNILYVVAP
jgi:hypothetical protein